MGNPLLSYGSTDYQRPLKEYTAFLLLLVPFRKIKYEPFKSYHILQIHRIWRSPSEPLTESLLTEDYLL